MIVGSDDPLAELPGGWQTLMRGFLRCCSRPERYALASPDAGTTGSWTTREYARRTFPFYGLGATTNGAFAFVSKRARTARRIVRRYDDLGRFGTIYSHGPELLLPFLLRRHGGRFVLHVIGDLRAEIAHGRLAGVRGAPVQRAYLRMAFAVMRRCERILWVDGSQIERLPPDIKSRSDTVSTFYDPAVFYPGDGPGANGEPLLISVGRLAPVKRVDLILRALAVARDRGEYWRLTVCGRGESEPGLRWLAGELGVEERVDWRVEYLDESKLGQLMRTAHVGVLVSAAEGSPSVVKEMLASGLPAIVSAVGDNAAVVRDGETGVVLDEVTPESVYEAVRRLLSAPPVRRQVAASVAGHSLTNWVGRLERALHG